MYKLFTVFVSVLLAIGISTGATNIVKAKTIEAKNRGTINSTRISKLETKKNKLLSKYTEDHPKIIAIDYLIKKAQRGEKEKITRSKPLSKKDKPSSYVQTMDHKPNTINTKSKIKIDPLVYVRCKRTTKKFDLTGEVTVNGVKRTVTRRMNGIDAFDRLPGVSNFFRGFVAPCDLILREASGEERVLYNCSSDSTDNSACAAMDPAVSFDGKTIAFSVFRGSLKKKIVYPNEIILDPAADKPKKRIGKYHYLPSKSLATTEAQLHLINVATAKITSLPHITGVYDSGPAFLPNGRLAFTSTRDGHFNTNVTTSTARPGTRIWTMDLDGKNIDLASNHSLSMEMHPYILKDGRLAYSSWQTFGGRPYRYDNGSIGGFDTLANIFHIYTQSPDGANNFAFYGQHSGNHSPSSFGKTHTAAHFLAQTSDGRVWIADYYRGNNLGLGAIVGVMPEPKMQEGMEPLIEAPKATDAFVPRDVIDFASWTGNADMASKRMAMPPFYHPNYTEPLRHVGKLGHPAALTNNGLLVSWGKGPCNIGDGPKLFGWHPTKDVPSHNTPGCDVGLYRATQIPSQHPGDLEMIVDSPDWHEIMARAVVPYQAIYGVNQPEIIGRADTLNSRPELKTGTPFGLLGAASITDRETHPRMGITFAGNQQFNLQGTDTIKYTDNDLCGIRILGILPNRSRNSYNESISTYSEIANITGERVSILGEFAVRNKASNGQEIIDKSGNPDTSFLVRMPANVPHMLQGIDCEGRTLNTDQTWQALRPGEMKTCGGCHVHSRESRLEFSETFAATTEYKIHHLGEGQVPLLTGKSNGVIESRTVPGYGMRIDYTRDIAPIFKRRCISCHGGTNPKGGLSLDRPGIDAPKKGTPASTWWCLVRDRSQKCLSEKNRFETRQKPWANYTFARPQITKYIRAFNSRGSLLYWKAAGKRTDNLTDDSYTDTSPKNKRDIDFGPAHMTEITSEELGLLSRWIDIGVPAGAKELKDTQKPTLNLSVVNNAGNVNELLVGTNDLGSGINPSSLVVCILAANGSCKNLAKGAKMHGIISIKLKKILSNPDTEILARVSDKSGNQTEVRRTLDYLLSSR